MPERKTLNSKKDKRRRAKITVPGQEKPVYVSGHTQAELNRKKKEKIDELIGCQTGNYNATWQDYVVQWWKVSKEPSIRTPGTLRRYRSVLNNHVIPAFDSRKLMRSVTWADLQTSLNAMAGRCSSDADLMRSVFQHVVRAAVREGILRYDVSQDLRLPIPKDRIVREPFTREQEQRFIDTADAHGGQAQLLLYLLFYTGMRHTEVLGLQWQDIQWKSRLIHVQRDIDYNVHPAILGQLKTRGSNRYIPIADPLYALLEAARGMPNAHVVGKDGKFLTECQYRGLFGPLMVDAGEAVPNERYYRRCPDGDKPVRVYEELQYTTTAHRFRHHFATACVEAGYPAQMTMEILGHDTYDVTLKVYTHVRELMANDSYTPSLLSEALRTKVATRLPGLGQKSAEKRLF